MVEPQAKTEPTLQEDEHPVDSTLNVESDNAKDQWKATTVLAALVSCFI
jgi:hypothetical protein